MKTQKFLNQWTRLTLAVCLALGFSLEAHAASATWTGTDANGLWNDNTNWGGSVSPGSVAVTGTTDVATFTGAATITSLGQNISLGEISTGAAGNNVSVTDASHSLTFSGSTAIAVGGGNLTLSASSMTFNNSGAITVGGTGTLTFGGTTSFGSKTLTFSGANGIVIFNGTVSNTSGTIVNQGMGMFANNTISVGNIKFGSTSAAKTGGFTISTSGVTVSSAIAFNGQTSGTAGTSNFTIGQNVSGGGTGTYSGGLNIANGTIGTMNVILNSAAGNTMFYTGAISGTNSSAALAIQGTGTVLLSGANTYSDGTSVTGGTTLEFANTAAMSATSTVSLAAGNTLAVEVGGTGQFTTTGTGTGTLAGIFSGTGGQTGSVISYAAGSNVGIDTGTNTVSYANAIVNPGGNSIGVKKLGSGGLTLTSGASTFTGTMTVASGTLVLGNSSGTVSTTAANNTNGSATGLGALVVNAGATLAGAGTSAGSSFSISGTSSASKALVLVGQTSASDTNTTGALTLLGGTGAGNSAITNATLNFNLDQSTPGSGNTLNVGATGITFGSSVTLALNMQNLGVIPATSSYVLIAGTGTTTISGGVTSGQYAGLNVILNGQGLEQIVASGNGQSGNVALALSGQAASWYGGGSYLYLNDSGGVDDIDVEIVPEPGTWAMMLGGLALLVFWQRRKNKA